MRGIVLLLLGVLGCAPEANTEDLVGVQETKLSSAQRRQRSTLMREVLAQQGIHNPLLFAGLASAETNMAHCWSEATWACKGPSSPDCGGGPVIAGSGDGACSRRQGGLGMFQFDAGTHSDTLRREGDRVLSLRGNIAAAGDFVVNMVRNSTHVSGVDTAGEAIAWINRVRPDSPEYEDWITTVVHYYNGCVPGRCGIFNSRYRRYDSHLIDRYQEFGHAYWYPAADSPTDCAGCDPAPAPVPEPRPEPEPMPADGCSDTCAWAGDGVCDDGGEGSSFDVCGYGTDCSDCGARSGAPSTSPTPEPRMCGGVTASCGSDDECCGAMSCRAGVTFGTRCCVEAGNDCSSSSDCCGAMVCNGGQCECNDVGKRCVEHADCCGNLCYEGYCY